MSARASYRAALGRLSRFGQEEAGTTLVELAIAIPLFLLIFLGLMDFGLFASTDVMAQKAVERATRLAVVRPPACAGVATVNTRGTVNP
ncbi:pilus assembly protein, partial [Thioclava sp. BHET1]